MGRKVLAVGRILTRSVGQFLVKRGKQKFVNYISQEYGQLAGGAAGIALSISVGDYYGAFTGISSKFGDSPHDRRNPPFGYIEGDAVNGTPNYQFHKTYSPIQYRYRNKRRRYNSRVVKCCKRCQQKPSLRSRRRFRRKSYLR